MPYDPAQLQTDADFLTQQPGWQDRATRRDWLRNVAVQSRAEADGEYHAALMQEMWGRVDDRGLLKKAADFTGRAVEDMAKSAVASAAAVEFAAADAAGITDTGSGARLRGGINNMLAGAAQRVKSLHPSDQQEDRDATLDALKSELDAGTHPAGLESWLAGDFDNGQQQPDAETQEWITALTDGLARKAQAADHTGPVDEARVKDWLAGDRNPARPQSADGSPGPRDMLADYLATRDPQSWEAFAARVKETDTAHTERARRFVAEAGARDVLAAMPDGLGKDMARRSFDIQASPIDLAASVFPLLRGGRALSAARSGAGGRAAAAAKDVAAEAAQEAGTELVMRPDATAAEVAEAGAAGAVGQAVFTGTGEAAGQMLRRGGSQPAAPAGGAPAPQPPSVEGQPVTAQQPGILAQIAARGGRQAPAAPIAPAAPVHPSVRPSLGVAGRTDDSRFAPPPVELAAPPAAPAAVPRTPIRRAPILQNVPDVPPAAPPQPAPPPVEPAAAPPAAAPTPARDATKPEQMTPAEFEEMRSGIIALYDKSAMPPKSEAEKKAEFKVQMLEGELKKARSLEGGNIRGVSRSRGAVKTDSDLQSELDAAREVVARERKEWDDERAARTEKLWVDVQAAHPEAVQYGLVYRAPHEGKSEVMNKVGLPSSGKDIVRNAIKESKPVSAAAVEAYGIKLPEGYTKKGELYVYSKPAETTAPRPLSALPAGRRAMDKAAALRHVHQKRGIPRSKVRVLHEAALPFRGRYNADGTIDLNTAHIGSIEELDDVLLNHEAIHDAIETDDRVRRKADGLLEALSEDELADIEAALHEYRDSGADNAALQAERQVEAIRKLTANRPDLKSAWGRLVEAVSVKLKKLLGADVTRREAELAAARILARGIRRVRQGKTGGRTSTGGALYGASQQPVTPQMDSDYLAAVDRGDMETAQRMVDEAAKAAGYDVGPVWHGTSRYFTTFDHYKEPNTPGAKSFGFYFSPDKNVASGYGEKTVKAFLRLANPLRETNSDWHTLIREDQMRSLIGRGYDGVIYSGKTPETIVFDSSQIKSADPITLDDDGNIIPLSQRFNPASPDIRYSLARADDTGPFREQHQEARKFLTGSALPRSLKRLKEAGMREEKAIEFAGAAIGHDLDRSMLQVARATGRSQQQLSDLAERALAGQLPITMLHSAMQEPVRRARNFLDELSEAIAQVTGGQMGKTILANLGQWMRRSYAAFDPDANWTYDRLVKLAKKGGQIAGRDAAGILSRARAHLRQENPAATAGELEAMMRSLMDRETWMRTLTGESTPGARANVTSLMHRKDLPAPLRELMGEERNPILKFTRSARFQAQFVARYDMQQRMRDLGLRTGLFSDTRRDTYTEPLGSDRGDSGFSLNRKPIYTTPELKAALDGASAPTPDGLATAITDFVVWLGGKAKLNYVALNPDSWPVNLIGNLTGLAQTGSLTPFTGIIRRGREAYKLLSSGRRQADTAAQQAVNDAKRDMMARIISSGVADSSMNLKLIEDGLDGRLVQFMQKHDALNRLSGAGEMAVLGQALGAPAGMTGRAVGGALGGAAGYLIGGKRVQSAQKFIANWTMQAPDNFGKIVEFLDNYETGLRAGMAEQAAFDAASEKAVNTMPDYSKLPEPLRKFSKFGMVGTFIAFKYELYRNFLHNARYAVQELGSGNPALMGKGARRLMGTAAVMSLANGGLYAALQGLGFAIGVGDDEDKAYRRALGRPWERNARLAYTQLDGEKASFYNTSYLLPQATFMELLSAAMSGSTAEQALADTAGVFYRQFIETGVHIDPLLGAIFNLESDGGKLSSETGWRQARDRLLRFLEPLTPGAAQKAERVLRSEELLARPWDDRSFTLTEEAQRMLGIRKGTYAHERRIAGRIGEFMAEKRAIAETANKAWRETGKTRADGWGQQEQEAAVARANERLAELRGRWDQFRADLKTALKYSDGKIERLRIDHKMNANWQPYRITADGIKQAER